MPKHTITNKLAYEYGTTDIPLQRTGIILCNDSTRIVLDVGSHINFAGKIKPI